MDIHNVSGLVSGRKDLNLRPLAPHASTLAGLRHAPIGSYYTLFRNFRKAFANLITFQV